MNKDSLFAILLRAPGAGQSREAHECIYVTAGELTDNASAFAAGKNIRLMQGAELAEFLLQPKKR